MAGTSDTAKNDARLRSISCIGCKKKTNMDIADFLEHYALVHLKFHLYECRHCDIRWATPFFASHHACKGCPAPDKVISRNIADEDVREGLLRLQLALNDSVKWTWKKLAENFVLTKDALEKAAAVKKEATVVEKSPNATTEMAPSTSQLCKATVGVTTVEPIMDETSDTKPSIAEEPTGNIPAQCPKSPEATVQNDVESKFPLEIPAESKISQLGSSHELTPISKRRRTETGDGEPSSIKSLADEHLDEPEDEVDLESLEEIDQIEGEEDDEQGRHLSDGELESSEGEDEDENDKKSEACAHILRPGTSSVQGIEIEVIDISDDEDEGPDSFGDLVNSAVHGLTPSAPESSQGRILNPEPEPGPYQRAEPQNRLRRARGTRGHPGQFVEPRPGPAQFIEPRPGQFVPWHQQPQAFIEEPAYEIRQHIPSLMDLDTGHRYRRLPRQ